MDEEYKALKDFIRQWIERSKTIRIVPALVVMGKPIRHMQDRFEVGPISRYLPRIHLLDDGLN